MWKGWSGISILLGTMTGIMAVSWNLTPTFSHYKETTLVAASPLSVTASPWRYNPQQVPKYDTRIHVEAGDRFVTGKTLNTTRDLIETVSLKVVGKNLGVLPLRTAHILLYATSDGYIKAVSSVFPQSEVTNATGQTAGFTYQSNIVLPMYLYSDPAYLANTLTHELTHVTLNQEELGAELPTWLNEGFAWYNGLQAERAISPVSEQQLFNLLMNGVVSARNDGKLLPLTAGEDVILHHNAQYNLEFFDYLAVNHLISTYGIRKFQGFLDNIHGEGLNNSFLHAFGISIQMYESHFYQTFQGGQMF